LEFKGKNQGTMLKLPIHILQPGMVLGNAITDERGHTLLREGIPLTDEYIDVLQQRGVSRVAVAMAETVPRPTPDTLPVDVYQYSKQALQRVFDFVRYVAAEFAADGGTPQDVKMDKALANVLQQNPDFDALEQTVSVMLDHILDKNTLTGLVQLRQSGEARLVHAINVATIGLLIGKSLCLTADDMKRLGTGCLLHDIGKIFFSQSLFKGNGKLPPLAGFTKMQDHTRLGYELLRSRNPENVMVNHVALEHHERQDGKGYPRGLRGTNQIRRTRFDRETILLISEITTVADVFDMLSRVTPAKPALTVGQIHATMRQLAGTFLNKEIVDILLQLLPTLPVGINVVAQTGRYSNYKGIVVSSNERNLQRPNIRLEYNQQGSRITPIDINLTAHSTTIVEATLL
jgi:putative nucleotidyltransferase with HDIG domain